MIFGIDGVDWISEVHIRTFGGAQQETNDPTERKETKDIQHLVDALTQEPTYNIGFKITHRVLRKRVETKN